jgi:hypothetical protein
MLTDAVYADVAQRTRKLLTFGAGLNKSWLLAPKLDRLYEPLVGDTLWTDFWASYDPVPAGPLDPSRHRLPDGAPCSIGALYQPSGDALAQVGPSKLPINEQVTNAMNVVTDHGGYFTNDEQVVLRLAAEISSAHHDRSAFWPAAEVLLQGVRARRVRVSALALWRDVVGLAWAVAAIGPWVSGLMRGIGPWQPISSLASSSAGAAGWLVAALVFARDSLPPLLAPVSGAAAMLLSLPAFVGLCALVGVVAWAIYSLVQWLVWQRWDSTARDRFVAACAASSKERLKATAPVTLLQA